MSKTNDKKLRYIVKTHLANTAVVDTADNNAVYVIPHNNETAKRVAIRHAKRHAKELNTPTHKP